MKHKTGTLLRITAALLSAVLAAGLAVGCTQPDTKDAFSPDTAAIEAEPETISFLAVEYDSQDYFKKAIEAFEKDYNKKSRNTEGERRPVIQ